MEKEFVTYEQALALKELGFDEPCFWWYDFEEELRKDRIGVNSINSNFPKNSKSCSAPLFSQAFRWFREKYKLYSCIERVEYINSDEKGFQWSIFEKCSNVGEELKTYEEAELECLKKLIEIVKEK